MTFAASVRAVTLFLSISAANAQLTGTGSISGRVLNAATGDPIPKATVSLMLGPPHDATAIAITDGSGRFGFQNLPVGAYRLHANKRGFLGLAFGTQRPTQAGTFITLADAEAQTDLVFRLPPMTAISGTVTDPDGETLKGVELILYRRDYRRGKQELVEFNRVATDDRGFYRFFNIQPNRYYVKANPPWQPNWNIPPGTSVDSLPQPMMSEFYPGTPDESQAKALDLRKGGELDRIDFRLRASTGGSVKGRVVTPEAMPDREKAHFQVVIKFSEWQGGYGIDTDSNGRFEIKGLPPGKHVISVNRHAPGANYFFSAEVSGSTGTGSGDHSYPKAAY